MGVASKYWKWWVCALLLFASTINYMDRMTLASVSRRVIDELHLTKADYGMVEQYFGYAFAFGAIIFGLIVDRVSPKWLYPAVLALWSAMGVLTAYAGSFGGISALSSLLLCRTLLGLFESGHWPCALQTTQRLLAPQDRALGNSILQSGVSIGAIVTPFIINAMLTPEAGSWRLPFIVIGAVGIVWVFAWIFTMRGQVIEVPVKSGEKAHWTTALREIASDHRFWLLAVVVSCINTTWSLYRVWLPLALQDKSGLAFTEEQTLGRILPIYYILTDIGCIAAGAATVWLHKRGFSVLNSRRWVFTVCSLLVLPAMFLPNLARGEYALPGFSPIQAAMLVLLMTAAGSLGVFPCYYAFTQELSKQHIGLVTGLLSFIAWIGGSSLQKPLGALIDRTGSYDFAFQAGAWPILGAAICLWLFWDLPWRKSQPA
ncbi:MAG: MFS transporter [Bryobacterales bacterium]|nr:MFS transporter [Bryobacterales bacterium]